MQKKLSNLNLFMGGAGSLGCATDNDSIELSNLSMQFLFRNSDIGKINHYLHVKKVKK